MKANFVLGLIALFIAVACEKEVNIYVPEQKPVIIYHKDNIRVESVETDNPTEGCSSGQVSVNVYRNDTLISSTIYCKDSFPNQELCPQYWDYLPATEGEACDTLYNYDCNGNLNFKVPICKPDTIVLPGEVIILPGDTVYVYDTIRITDELAYVVFPLLYEDCDKGSSPYYHNELGYTILETGFSINPYFDDFSKSKHGTIVFYGTDKDSGILWSPYLSSPMCQDQLPNLYATYLYSGSRIESEQQFWVMYEDGSIEKIKSGTTRINSDFEWSKNYDDKTWDKENLFIFKEDDLKNPKAPGIIKTGIGYKKTSNKPILCRNDKYNGDEWHIWGYKLINNSRK